MRLWFVLLLGLLATAPASATIAPARTERGLDRRPVPEKPLVVDEGTEVLLDGKAVEYADIPAGAEVVELKTWGRHVDRIAFRSRGKP